MSQPTPKPTLVMIPGHLCERSIYAPQFKAFWNQADIQLADVNHDGTVQEMAQRLLASFEGPLALMGLSMGGMVAMEAIAAAPERISGAALICTDPTPARETEVQWRLQHMDAVRDQDSLEPYVTPFVANFFAHSSEAAEQLGPQMRALMMAADREVFLRQCHALNHRRDMLPSLAAFTGPLAVICAAQDRLCPPLLHRKIVNACPEAAYTEIPDCGHMATLENPHAVIQALGGWLVQLQR
ncbi:MAG: alpha/beta hydrolase [Neomegalonema sp.]|nr:alpha/beta hydrolase [Neomegalonema sp.]